MRLRRPQETEKVTWTIRLAITGYELTYNCGHMICWEGESLNQFAMLAWLA
jgi:hypothetical protein